MSDNSNGWEGIAPKRDGSKTLFGAAAQVTKLDGDKFRISYFPKRSKDGSEVPVYFPGTSISSKIFENSQLPVRIIDDEFDETLIVISSETDEGLKVTHFQPWEGTVTARFVEYYRPNGKDTPPAPYEGTRKTGGDGTKSWDYSTLDYRAYWKIETPVFFKDEVLVQFLQYSKTDFKKKVGEGFKVSSTFVRNEANGLCAFGFATANNNTVVEYNSSKNQMTLDYLNVAGGMVEPPFPYPEDGNVLPIFEKRLQKQNRLVKLTIEKGHIVDIHKISKFDNEGVPVQVQPAASQVNSDPDEM